MSHRANTALEPSMNCVDLVKHFETLHDGDLKTIGLQPKLCPTGYWTEGYGRRVLGKDKEPLTWKHLPALAIKYSTIKNESQALAALGEDLAIRRDTVKRLVTMKLTQHQFDALVSFEYNLGALAKSSLLVEINKGNWAAAAREFDRWVWGLMPGQKAKVQLPGLVRRRRVERALFEGLDHHKLFRAR